MITYEQFEMLCFLDYPPWEIHSTWDKQCYNSRILRYIQFEDGKVITFENWGRVYLGHYEYKADWKELGSSTFHEVPRSWMKAILSDTRFTNNLCRWKVFKPIWKEIKNERR
tara:strand:- start:255 stop:590 length:336 start_codon:yes stop_codon:yes gene_type:complete